jgi:hypothetical protein
MMRALTYAGRRGLALEWRVVGGIARRFFFASSTDHTRLLDEADVHRVTLVDGVTQYVMAPNGTDLEIVQKVPQLHLARLFVKDNVLYGAKVINRTLGEPKLVCGKILDAALQDVGIDKARARSTLHGLSDWVLDGMRIKKRVDSLSGLSDGELSAIEAIAKEPSTEKYDTSRMIWEKLAQEYIDRGCATEAALYQSREGVLTEIEHHADTSELANTSGGAMALFEFQ